MAAQKRLHGMGLEHSPRMSVEEIDRIVEMLGGAKCAASYLHEEEEIAIDDQSGAVLEPKLMRETRQAEIAYFKSIMCIRKFRLQSVGERQGEHRYRPAGSISTRAMQFVQTIDPVLWPRNFIRL